MTYTLFIIFRQNPIVALKKCYTYQYRIVNVADISFILILSNHHKTYCFCFLFFYPYLLDHLLISVFETSIQHSAFFLADGNFRNGFFFLIAGFFSRGYLTLELAVSVGWQVGHIFSF